MASSEKDLKYVTKTTGDDVLQVQRLEPTIKGEGKADETGSSKMEPVTTRTLPQLPIEVWENAIHHLWDDQNTLRKCSLVCRAWYPPCRFHLHRLIEIRSVKGVKAYAKMLKQTPELSNRTHDMNIISYMDLSALSIAAILLARKLPRLEWLRIWNSKWEPWMMHRDVFLHLSGFSVTRLDLIGVTFPSITVFGRLVCALPRLVRLDCEDLTFTHDHFHRDTFGLYHNRVNVRSLSLAQIPLASEKLVDFLAHPCISSRLQKLIIGGPISVAELQYKWRCQPLLNAASGSLSEMRLDLRLGDVERWTDVKMSAADSVLSFTHNTSLQRLWLTHIDISQEFGLDTLCRVLLSIKSGQLREVVIVFRWLAPIPAINKLKEELKNLLSIRESTHQEEIDNYLSSDSFRMLSKVEFALTPNFAFSKDRDATVTATEEQWKQLFAPLFPRLTERGIFRAIVRDSWSKGNF